jgi:hypothetical protein
MIATGNFQKIFQNALIRDKVNGWGGSLTMTLNPNQNVDGTLTGNWRLSGLSSAADRLSTFGLFGQIRHKGIGTTFRYVDGPQFYFDYLNPQAGSPEARLVQISAFGEWSTKSKNLQTRFQVMFNRTSTIASMITSRGEVIWNLPRRGLSVILTGMTSQRYELIEKPLFNLTFRKSLEVPLPFVQKYSSLKVVLYKDLNRNDTLDHSDERIGQTLITIQNKHLRTNSRGEAYLKNVLPDDYLVDLSGIHTLRGWAPREGLKQSIVLTNDTYLAIPFNKSKYVNGKVVLEKDVYTLSTTTLDGIRVTAVSSRGDTYYAITNVKGEFFFNLIPDEYIVQIKEDVMGNEYRILESSQKVDLTSAESGEVEFKVVQRKRQINIQKK